MKKMIVTIIAVLFSGSILFAQDYNAEADYIKSLIGIAKKDFISSIVDIPEDKTVDFWTIYNQYSEKQDNIGNDRVRLLLRYIGLFDSNDDKQYKNLIKDVFSVHKKSESNLKKYYKKIHKAISAKAAMQFFQAEEYLRSSIENKIYSDLPVNE